jgi:ribosomal protein S1
MRNIRSLCATPLAIAALSLGLPGTAAAEDCKVQTADGKTINGRIFEGMIKKVSKRDFTITKGGEMVKFVPYKDVAVKGEKTEYKKLKKDDWLRICFRRMDKPRYAYDITVIPAPDDKAEEL